MLQGRLCKQSQLRVSGSMLSDPGQNLCSMQQDAISMQALQYSNSYHWFEGAVEAWAVKTVACL